VLSAFAAIADDITGACDVAAELATAGMRARVVVEPGAAVADDEQCVSVVNTQSRALAPAAAAARVRAALGVHPVRLVLKKIDTALRGHLGAELDAALAHLGATGFVVPAIPSAGRVTRGGCQWFDGRLLAETEFARDPEGSGAISSVAEAIARESRRAVATLDRACVGDGSLAAAVRRQRRAGIDCFVVDAESDADVRRAVAAITALPGPLCLAGSIALAAALAPRLRAAGAAAAESWWPAPPGLVVNGSLHSRARAQVDAVLARGGVVALAASGAAGQEAVAARAAAALAAGTSVVVTPRAAAGVPTAAARRATEAALADLVAAIVSRERPETLVLIGGETSYAILRRIGAGAIAVHGRVVPLVSHGRILHGAAAGTRLVTKGGSGGDPGVVAACLAATREAAPGAAEGAPGA
jgi:uncharacterized protein YgbK (DUF1537 family)